ncbi:MAG: hypothetical protein EOM62_19190 [Bacteroidia bacterium]|nr:hypothetical protein [Bacteroidia bacterium]
MMRIQSLVHQLSNKSLVENEAFRASLQKKIPNETKPWKKGFMLHLYGDTFGHIKVQKIQKMVSGGCIAAPPVFETVGFKTGTSTYIAGVGHGVDGYDPDLVALRPNLAKQYLVGLFQALGGKDTSKLKDIFSAIDQLGGSGLVDHPDKWLKDASYERAVETLSTLAHEKYGYGELTYGRQYFNPEDKTFFFGGKGGWKLTPEQIEEFLGAVETK